jgi:ABC-type polysaccharide transport system permease subunit
MEAGFKAVFGQPVAYHDGDFGQGLQNDGYVGFKLLFDLLSAENVNQIVKEVGIDVSHPFYGLFAAFLKKRIAFLTVL